MSITWQIRGANGPPVVVECYKTVAEAVSAMAGLDGRGGVWEEEDRTTRLRGVDTLVDDESGEVVAVATYGADDSLMVLVPGPGDGSVAQGLHLYKWEGANWHHKWMSGSWLDAQPT